jgi:hypothetical protein
MVDWLTDYFRRQAELGSIRTQDPRVSGYAFLGLMGSYILGRDILQPDSEDLPAMEVYVWGALELFLDGLESHAGEPATTLAFAPANTPNSSEGGKG